MTRRAFRGSGITYLLQDFLHGAAGLTFVLINRHRRSPDNERGLALPNGKTMRPYLRPCPLVVKRLAASFDRRRWESRVHALLQLHAGLPERQAPVLGLRPS